MSNKTAFISLVFLASSIGLRTLSWAALPLNTVNNGRIIKGGTYYNTPDGFTSFINNQSGGLWLRAGTIVRELEANGAVNGGTVVLTAGDHIAGNAGRLSGVTWSEVYFGSHENRSALCESITNGQGTLLSNDFFLPNSWWK